MFIAGLELTILHSRDQDIVNTQRVPIGVKAQLSERVSSLTRRSLPVNETG